MPSTPTYKNLSTLVEQPTSGLRVHDASHRLTKVYVAEISVAVAAQKSKGTLGSGALDGWVIESSTVEPLRGALGRLTDVWYGGEEAGATLPPDEVAVAPDNLSPRLESHPRYLALEGQQVTVDGVDVDELLAVQNAAQATDAATRKKYYDVLSASGQELVKKIQSGHESYYLAALRYAWVTHSFAPPTMYRGGWIEAPGGPLAAYFVADIQWLRESDDLQFSQGIWRLTRSWLGGPIGHWDADIYS